MENQEWKCLACTFINKKTDYLTCEICEMEKEEEPDTSSSSTTKRSRSINSNSRPSPSSSPDGKKKPRPTSPPSSSTSSSNTNYSIFQGKSEKRNSNPPGLFTAGLRRNGAEDKDGKRSLSLEDYKTLLKQHSIEVVVDMRVGRGTAKCKFTLEGKGCNISEPKWACDCSIEGVHNKLEIEYLFRGTTISTNKGGEPSGYNLGGTNINCLCRNDKGVEERKWIKNGGQLRRAMMDSNNTKGKDCENDAKKTISGVVYDEHAKKELDKIFNLANKKRVLLICVEDELHKCHKNDWVKIYVDEGRGEVIAIEPSDEVSSQPGVGWTNFPINLANRKTYDVTLKGLSAARRPPDSKKKKKKN